MYISTCCIYKDIEGQAHYVFSICRTKFLEIYIRRSVGPFPAGVILHSFNGSAEVVPKLAELGAYFSFSGWFTYIDEKIAKKTLKSVCLFSSVTIQLSDQKYWIKFYWVWCRFLPIGSYWRRIHLTGYQNQMGVLRIQNQLSMSLQTFLLYVLIIWLFACFCWLDYTLLVWSFPRWTGTRVCCEPVKHEEARARGVKLCKHCEVVLLSRF